MGIEIVLFHVVRIITGDDFDIVFSGQFYKCGIHFILFFHAVSLQFHIKIVLKNIEPPFEFIFAFGFTFFQNSLWYGCANATSGRY